MYAVSKKYLEAMRMPVQRHRMKGSVGDTPFTEADILEGSFSITGQCSDASNVQIGQVYVTELKMTLTGAAAPPRYSLIGAPVRPHFGMRLRNGAYEYIPLGVFTVSSASRGESGVQITAYDNMSRLDRSFTSTRFIGTPHELCTIACESCGLELGMGEADFARLANGTARLQLYADNDIRTWRDALAWTAQTLACNVFADRAGRIVLRAYGRKVADTLGPEDRIAGCTFGDYETRYTGVSVTDIETQTTEGYGPDDGLVYALGANPFLQTPSEGTVGDMAGNILAALGEVRYVPFTVSAAGNPAYDLMDVFRFRDGLADGERVSCMTKYTFVYNSKYTMQGVGQNPELITAGDRSDRSISGLMEQMKSITGSINNLIYDFNTGPVRIGQREQTLGMATYYISERADVEGHFLMRYTATGPTALTVRFYDRGVQELYSPVVEDIQGGDGFLSVPHAYLRRAVGIHSVYVTASCLSGTVTVPTRGAFLTLDAGNFAEAVDDISLDVRDITMRQLLESNGPDQIWVAGLEDGELLVSRRAYSGSYHSNPEWEGVFTPGAAVEAAIEFDGEWVLRPDDVRFTLETEDQPWLFWVDGEGALLAQRGEDAATRTGLDTGVTRVSACRGYSSIHYPEQDQGLVVAYIKDGLPRYRQYVRDAATGGKRWLPPEPLGDGAADDVRVHRLNDYRLGFEVSAPGRNIWMYTDRTYVGQAVPKERGTVRAGDGCLFLYAGADEDVSVEYTADIALDGLTLYVHSTRRLRYHGTWRDLISVDPESVPRDGIAAVETADTDGGTVITVILKERPGKLLTAVTVNPGDSPSVQAEIPGAGHVKAPTAELVLDTTVYRRLAPLTEEAAVRCAGSGARYGAVTEYSLTADGASAGVLNTDPGMRYSPVTEGSAGTYREAAGIIPSAYRIEYEQAEPSPI